MHKKVTNEWDFLQDILSHPGHAVEEEKREDAGARAEQARHDSTVKYRSAKRLSIYRSVDRVVVLSRKGLQADTLEVAGDFISGPNASETSFHLLQIVYQDHAHSGPYWLLYVSYPTFCFQGCTPPAPSLFVMY